MKTPIFMLTSPDSPTLPGAVERINTGKPDSASVF